MLLEQFTLLFYIYAVIFFLPRLASVASMEATPLDVNISAPLRENHTLVNKEPLAAARNKQ